MNGMSLIVKTVTRWTIGFIFLFGWYIILFAHLTPGGGFAGGVILAAGYVLLLLAFGQKVAKKKLNLPLSGELDALGALLFLLIGIIGLWLSGLFLTNFLQHYFPGHPFALFSAGVIPLCNLAIGIKVGASLYLVLLVLSLLKLSSDDNAGT